MVIRRLLSIFIVFLVSLFLLEIGLRFYQARTLHFIGVSQMEISPEERYLWWGGAKIADGKQQHHYIISKNPRLFYEPTEWFYSFKERIEKNQEAYKIFILGDSTTRLKPEPDDRCIYYPCQLEALLKKSVPYKNFIVGNFGIPGYSTAQEVEFLEKRLLKFHPDLVIVGYCFNDKEVKHRIIKKGEHYYTTNLRSDTPYCPFLPFSENVYIYSDVYKALDYCIVNMCRKFDYKINYADIGAHQSMTALKRLKYLSDKYKFRLVFILLPDFLKSSDKEKVWIKNALKETGIDFIDVSGILENYKDKNIRIAPDDRFHFNEVGHGLVSGILEEFIEKKIANEQ